MDYELGGYAPDYDPTLKGVVTNCSAWLPSVKGMEAAPSASSLGIAALAAECRGAAILKQLDETVRFLAGTTTNMYEEGSGSWTSRYACGAGETLSATDRWRFGVFGNIELAVAKTVPMIASDSGAMSTVSLSSTDAPSAALLETVGDFVFLGDYNDGTDTPDGVFWSSQANYQQWTPSRATQCGNQRLYGTPGKITALKRFGEAIAVYKKTGIYMGVYGSDEFIWTFPEVPGDVGALCQEVVVDIGTETDPRHIFMSRENFFILDGLKTIPVGNPVKDTVFNEINREKEEQSIALHDRLNSRVYFFYPVGSNNYPDKCVVYNYRSNKWGRDDRTIQAAIEHIATGVTYDALGTDYPTYDSLPEKSYNTAFLAGSAITPAVFDSTNTVMGLNGEPGDSSFTTNEFGSGDNTMYSLLTRAKPKYLTAPSVASMVNFFKYNIGDAFTTGTTTGESSERFDVYKEARWHQLRFDFTGSVEMSSVRIDIQLSGDE